MRLVRFDGGATGILIGDGADTAVLDVHATLGSRDTDAAHALAAFFPDRSSSWLPIITAWAEIREPMASLRAMSADAVLRPMREVRLEAPLPDPGVRIFAMGGNFAAHVSAVVGETSMAPTLQVPAATSPPWGYYVIPGTVVGQDAVVRAPAGVRKLDYEAEVAVVLGAAETALAAGGLPVWGYTAWNDFSIRDGALGLTTLDHGPLTWSLQKNFDTGNACGPCLVVDEPVDLRAVTIECRVNGAVRQQGTTAQMIHPFDRIAGYIAGFLTLTPGDMIVSGTPAGTAMESGVDGPFLEPGDVTEVDVGGVGVLRCTVGTPRPDGGAEPLTRS